MSVCRPTPRASRRPNSTRVWTSSAQRSPIPTEPCYDESFSSQRTSQNSCQWDFSRPRLSAASRIRGAKKLPLLLNAPQLQTMADNIASLCNALATNEHFSTKDGDFKMNTTGSYTIARVYLDKQFFSFTYEELRNLAYAM